MLRIYTYVRRATFEPPSNAEWDPFDAWFAAHPYATPAGAYVDLGVSGLRLAHQRDGFGALLDAMDRELPDFVLLCRWADLGRATAVSQHARRLLESRGVVLLSATEPALDLAPARLSA